jgi:hypothetical protein
MTSVSSALENRELPEIGNLESARSGISFAAIVGGAVAAVAATLFLVALGSALGFASASPWTVGASAASLGIGAGIWVVVTQWLSSAFGGYLTGRLRTKWAFHSSDEVFFRDTAHGFLAWALATVFVFGLAMSIAGGAANMAATVGAGAAQGAAEGAADSEPMGYFVDTLFRAPPAAGAETVGSPAAGTSPSPVVTSRENGTEARAESGRVLARSLTTELTPEDRSYLGQQVAAETGLSQADAEARVDQVVTTAKQQADDARKAAGALAFFTALSLLIGAFVAAAAGALGGRHRDMI